MHTVEELQEVLSAFGITQCDYCGVWSEGQNFNEDEGLLACTEHQKD